jgi:hypothetical protein
LAGAAGAAALSLILLILGTGLGLSSVSPWVNEGISATTFGVTTIVWIILTALIASGMGGYLAGRLRTRWLQVDSDEIQFRDTAHGFLTWAIASLATAALLTSVIGSIVSGGLKAGATVAGGVATTAAATTGAATAAGSEMAQSDRDSGPMGYFIDSLFRQDPSTPAWNGAVSGGAAEQSTAAATSQVTRIFMNAMRTGTLPEEDLRYVGQVVAQHTGLTQQEAEQRVGETYARAQATLREAEIAARDAADEARKASAYAALWLFVSLLVGAFAASLAATFGGRQRDLVA